MEIAENPQITYTINLAENIIIFYRSIHQFSEKIARITRISEGKLTKKII
jgi:hypothetical protein